MTLLEAMKSGRRFRVDLPYAAYYYQNLNGELTFDGIPVPIELYLLSQEYELEPLPEKRVEVTASQLDKCVESLISYHQPSSPHDIRFFCFKLKRELGL